jgi:hypothetical protein
MTSRQKKTSKIKNVPVTKSKTTNPKTIKNYENYISGLRKRLPDGYDLKTIDPDTINGLSVKEWTKNTYVSALLYFFDDELVNKAELRKYAKDIRDKQEMLAPSTGNLPSLDELQKVYHENGKRAFNDSSLLVAFYFYPFIDKTHHLPIRNELASLIVGSDDGTRKNTYNPTTGEMILRELKSTAKTKVLDADLSDNMKKCFNMLIESKGLKNGDKVFGKLTSAGLSKTLGDYSKRIIGKSVTSSVLRKAFHHIFLGEKHKQIAELKSEIKETTDKMGHEPDTAMKWYSKYELL